MSGQMEKMLLSMIGNSLAPEYRKYLTQEGMAELGSKAAHIAEFVRSALILQIHQNDAILANQKAMMTKMKIEDQFIDVRRPNDSNSDADTNGTAASNSSGAVAA